MKASDDTRQHSPATLKAERARGTARTRVDAPAYPVDEDFWRNARTGVPPPNKASIHLRLDAEVLEWFREQARGHLSRMNAILRSVMGAHKR
jgi:uncharacterized protein (DUF4415 family)